VVTYEAFLLYGERAMRHLLRELGLNDRAEGLPAIKNEGNKKRYAFPG
jgi:hypothetical protein